MKVLKTIKLLLLITFVSVGINLSAQDFSSIGESIEKGDVVSLSTHFDSNPELTILNIESIYSNTQMSVILKDFFSKNKPLSYNVIHHGNSMNGTFFQIGELSTSTVVFRTYLFIKNVNGVFLIQEFRIE